MPPSKKSSRALPSPGSSLDASETIEVPAGKFLAMKVEVTIATADPADANRRLAVRETHWYARTVLRPVRVVSETTVADEAPQVETVELLAYRIE